MATAPASLPPVQLWEALACTRPPETEPRTAPAVRTVIPAARGNSATRWSSAFSDPQWIRVDLGQTYSIGRVRLVWEAAYGSAYQIQTSPDGGTWTTVRSVTGGVDDLTGLSGSARYVRVNGTTRTTAWGYSLFEFEVYAP